MLTSFISLLGLAASVSAHVDMVEPAGWETNNFPLEADGSNFPCKGVSYDSSVAANVMNKGESQPLSFIGTAVHGGGSCQVSLTTDLSPTKDSVWKVIKSIEGGCPAQGEAGNLPGEDASFPNPYKYDFTIPDDVPAGNYTLAWTWFNRIGNREMYMQCAPAVAVGDGGSESSFNALPDMFTANIGNGCGTTEGTDLKFPNPGLLVDLLGDGTFSDPEGNCATGGSGGGSGGDSGAPPTEPEAPINGGESELPGGVFVPVPTGGSGTQPAPEVPVETEPAYTPEEPVESAPVESAPVEDEEPAPLPSVEVPANGGEEDGAGAGGYAAGTACTTEGTWNCIGGSSFQRCASGIWSATQALAAGTSCVAGEAANIQLSKRGTTRFGAKFIL